MSFVHDARPGLKIGQRVRARFDGGSDRLGVVTGEFSYGAYPVQFQPHGSHFHCHHVAAYGDAKGWTNAEYRIERESSYCETRAMSVETERRAKYPDTPFSMAPVWAEYLAS